ncbi:MAG: histidine--tRNA ligase [Campylobacterales bacterium]|nr:histidine--tRNA ligase [Campylobacterales bacterium]
MLQALRGMKDLIDDGEKFNYFVKTAENVAKKYGFSFVETPILEETSLYIRSVGESSDIVGKEMYRFEDKGGNDVSMRPEGTAGVVRAFVEKKLDRKGGLNRFYYCGPMFRYERPQKGRLRQFHQFGIESFGEESVYEDAAVITLAKNIFDDLGIGCELQLNSLGCKECMPTYRETLVSFLRSHQDKICDDCKKRTETNPIRTLDCKNSECQNIYVDAPKITDNLCQNCDTDFEKLKKLLEASNIEFSINKNLVRGLDYYNKTAFEFVSKEIGAQSAIAGGGRYDKLVEYLDGKETPAVGFAIGIERIFPLFEKKDESLNKFYIGAMDEKYTDTSFILAVDLRRENEVTFEPKTKSLKSHLKGADKVGAKYCCVIGENEGQNNEIWVKDLEAKEEKVIKQEDLKGLIG